MSELFSMVLLKMANARKEAMIADGRAARLSHQELADLGDDSPYFKYTI